MTPGALVAQGVRVQIVDDRTREPIGGAIVSLIDARGESVMEGLTSTTGHRLLAAPAPGDYRILVRRVGYVPVSSPVVAVPAGDPIPYVLAVSGQRVVLPSVISRARRECRTQVDEIARTAVLWEEIRKALTASELTREERYSPIQLRVVERKLDADGHATEEAWSPWVSTFQAPFVATSAAELSRNGYLMRDDGKPIDFRARDLLAAQLVWHGPDAAVLLSPEFERDHCFQLVAGSGATADAIGLAFTPVEGRKLPDIAGTLWVDRETAELRFVEFEYVNTSLPDRVSEGGGRIEFEHLATGEWIVRDWTLRYPRISVGRRARDYRLLGFNEVGGQAAPARVGRLTGTVYDSLAGEMLHGARISVTDGPMSVTAGADGHYEIDSLLPGAHELVLSHAVLDSLGVGVVPFTVTIAPGETATRDVTIPSHRTFRSACGSSARVVPDSGMVAGAVLDANGVAVPFATVTFSWMPAAAADSLTPAPVVIVRTDERGSFAACGLPVGTAVTARAGIGARASADVGVIIGRRAIAKLDLVLRPHERP